MTEADRSVEGYAPVQGWDAGLQVQIAELNAQLLELLRARAAGGGAGDMAPPLVTLAPLLQRLGEPAIQALARCPYLMLDAGFSRPDYWGGAVNEQVDTRGGGWLAPIIDPDMVRRAVVLGWHLARANPYAARLSLGMTPHCARLIARMRLRDLELLVGRRATSSRLRWEDRPAVWHQLLEAAVAGSIGRLEALQLRGLQLLAADYRPQR